MKYWNSFRFFFCTSMKVHVKCQFFLYLIICVPKNHHCDFLEVTRELTLQLFRTDGNSHRKKRRRMQYLNDVLLPGKNLSSMSGGNLFRIGLSATCVGKCFCLVMQKLMHQWNLEKWKAKYGYFYSRKKELFIGQF